MFILPPPLLRSDGSFQPPSLSPPLSVLCLNPMNLPFPYSYCHSSEDERLLSLFMCEWTLSDTTSLSLCLLSLQLTFTILSPVTGIPCDLCVMFHVNTTHSTVEIHLNRRLEHVLSVEVRVLSMCRITFLLYISVLAWHSSRWNVCLQRRHRYTHYQQIKSGCHDNVNR